ncbi:MAG TPA: M48 family metalloprotease [Thermoanaerobaculia bacterium]|jgi:predicted Zn-dependent protease|nr:M48 family metalloprotease [Thermoanaerobaculia bacterium]
MDPFNRRRTAGGGFGKGRLIIAFIVALVAVAGYYGSRSFNPLTEKVQHVSITPQQEVALGLQAAPEMAQQFGGLHPDQKAQQLVDRVCHELITRTSAKDTPYDYDCHVLADERTLNAFALPGGQVFITAGLLGKLQTEGQLAGVLGHEIGHVVARHGAEHIAKARLTQGLTGAAVLASYDPSNPASRRNAAVAALIGQLVTMRFGRQDELESDRLGVRFLSEAGYDPRGMIEVMKILEQSGGGSRQPEFFSTHPNPANRITNIEAAIKERFPRGVPAGLRS